MDFGVLMFVTDFSLGEMGRTDATGRSRQLKKLGARFKRLRRAGRFWAN